MENNGSVVPGVPVMPLEFIKTQWGWQVAPPGDQFVTGSYRKWGVYSDLEVKILSRLIGNTSTAIVAGGNIGGVAIPLTLKTGARVNTFEPQPLLAQLLQANKALANAHRLDIYNAALGATAGTIKVPMIDFACDYNMGRFGREDWEREFPPEATADVRMMSFVEQVESIAPDLILLDVEGMELELLDCIKKWLIEQRTIAIGGLLPILWVEDDRPEQHAGLMQFMEDVGYVPYWAITPLTPEGVDPMGGEWPSQASFNLLCVPARMKGSPLVRGLREAQRGDTVGSCPADWMITQVG